jgi:hypothetical protein
VVREGAWRGLAARRRRLSRRWKLRRRRPLMGIAVLVTAWLVLARIVR